MKIARFEVRWKRQGKKAHTIARPTMEMKQLASNHPVYSILSSETPDIQWTVSKPGTYPNDINDNNRLAKTGTQTRTT